MRLAEIMEEYKQTTGYALDKKYDEVSISYETLSILGLATFDLPEVFGEEWSRIEEKIRVAEAKIDGIRKGLRMAKAICPDGYSCGVYCYVNSKREEWERAKAKALQETGEVA